MSCKTKEGSSKWRLSIRRWNLARWRSRGNTDNKISVCSWEGGHGKPNGNGFKREERCRMGGGEYRYLFGGVMLQKVGREWSGGHFIKRGHGKNSTLFCFVR